MKRSDIPVLDDLRAFEAVARLGSVRAAADELALTHGAVSRRVSKLARECGLTLLEPAGRGLRLTSAGEKLAAATGQSFEILTECLRELRQDRQPAPLALSCERSIAMRWLIPRLGDFYDSHPGLDLHLSVGGGAFDFTRDRLTMAIRRLDFPIDPGWEVLPLCREETGPVMQPGMVADFTAGRFPALASRTRPDAWAEWTAGHPELPVPTEFRWFDHHFLMVEAAASGLGVAICPRLLAADDLARGRLDAPLGFCADGSEYGLILPAPPEEDGALRLVKWLQGLFAVL